jgi:hypothetical protein
MAVMRWVYYRDAATDLRQATMPQSTNRTSRFFKPMTDAVKHQIQLQLDHIRNGCLSDPPKEKVPITRVNPVTKDAFTARSTGTNEVDNRYLNRLLDTPSVGIARAERLISDHYERSNDRKRCRRLGEPEAISYRTERLYFLNSIAKSAGFAGDELPVKVAYPPLMPLVEFMGLQYELPAAFRENSDTNGDDVIFAQEEEDRATGDLHNFLTGIDFEEEDEDIPVDSDQFRHGTEEINNNGNNSNERNAPDANMEPIPIDFDALEEEVARILPLVKANETTFQTFCRLTADQPWVPFKHPKDPSFGPIDRCNTQPIRFTTRVPDGTERRR